LLISPIQT